MAAAATLVSVHSASADHVNPVNNWTGAVDNLWATAGNWSAGSVPQIAFPRADDVYFNDGAGALNITMPGGQQAGRLNFLNTATTTLNSGASAMNISLHAGINMAAGAGTVTLTHTSTNQTINLNGTTQSIINNSTNPLNIQSH